MNLTNATSSQDSADGAWLYELLGYPTITESGPPAARASLSARQAREQGLLMRGTSGQPSSTSPASAALQDLLVSRLQAATQSLGSTLYKMTWKPWAMPSGRSRFRLRASVLRTSETARTGWPTPSAQEFGGDPAASIARKQALGIGNTCTILSQVATLAGWVSPQAADANGSGKNQNTASLCKQSKSNLAGWPTPTAKLAAGGGYKDPEKALARVLGPHANDLRDFAKLTEGCPARLTVSGQLLTGSDAGMESGGQLNPAHSLWLMACPSALAHSAPGSNDWLRWQGLMQQVLSERKHTAPGCSQELEMLSTSKPPASLLDVPSDLSDLL